MKSKITVNALLFAIIIMAIVCFGLYFENCVNCWKIYYSELHREIPVQEFIDSYWWYSWEATAMLIMFVCTCVICIVVLVIINKTELQSLTCTVKEHKKNYQRKKEEKQAAEKQRKIEALQKELNDLKNDKQ